MALAEVEPQGMSESFGWVPEQGVSGSMLEGPFAQGSVALHAADLSRELSDGIRGLTPTGETEKTTRPTALHSYDANGRWGPDNSQPDAD